ncbi:hypothetical protein DESC_690091 [Desulfosarcina cetonica]|nr:hypothetical protein DESC_690091 [Desulfosarcina cetonica]
MEQADGLNEGREKPEHEKAS